MSSTKHANEMTDEELAQALADPIDLRVIPQLSRAYWIEQARLTRSLFAPREVEFDRVAMLDRVFKAAQERPSGDGHPGWTNGAVMDAIVAAIDLTLAAAPTGWRKRAEEAEQSRDRAKSALARQTQELADEVSRREAAEKMVAELRGQLEVVRDARDKAAAREKAQTERGRESYESITQMQRMLTDSEAQLAAVTDERNAYRSELTDLRNRAPEPEAKCSDCGLAQANEPTVVARCNDCAAKHVHKLHPTEPEVLCGETLGEVTEEETMAMAEVNEGFTYKEYVNRLLAHRRKNLSRVKFSDLAWMAMYSPHGHEGAVRAVLEKIGRSVVTEPDPEQAQRIADLEAQLRDALASRSELQERVEAVGAELTTAYRDRDEALADLRNTEAENRRLAQAQGEASKAWKIVHHLRAALEAATTEEIPF